MTEFIQQVEFTILPANTISNQILEECSLLFSKSRSKYFEFFTKSHKYNFNFFKTTENGDLRESSQANMLN